MADKVLIVDDDPAISRLISKVMHSCDLESEVANSGTEALSIIRSRPFDLILMDVMLGDMEGFDVIQTIRNEGVITPVIIISGRSEDYDMVYGLSLGADDYVTKPFRPNVLGAKVKALIRRSKSILKNDSNHLTCGPFLYERETMRFYKDHEELVLSAKEQALLLLFIQHPHQVLTKELIYEHIWGNLIAVDDNTIMVYINRLRNKIEENARDPRHIITIRGLGYRFIP
ncbi:MAG: response regulator transcription factor [Clostridiales bacterium]|nr:response regulator transcription factor [Clostridiales bacterium]